MNCANPFDAAYARNLARARSRKAAAESRSKAGRAEARTQTDQGRKEGLRTFQPRKGLLRQKAATRSPATWFARSAAAAAAAHRSNRDQVRTPLPDPPRPALPRLTDLDPAQIARFEEQSTSPMGVDLEVQSTRLYPYQTTAAHLLGPAARRRLHGRRRGLLQLSAAGLPRRSRDRVRLRQGAARHGRRQIGAGEQRGYRQTENVWSPAEAGHERGADD